jgi:hypothetical protein
MEPAQAILYFGTVQSVLRLISALAISAYLTAIFLPCGSPPSVSLMTLTKMPTPAVHALPSEAESTASRMAASHSHSHEASHEVSQKVPRKASHAATHESAHGPGFEEPGPIERTAATELKPTCLCGCSDTRSQIGGGSARLGSVVPGTVVAHLLEVEAAAPGVRVLPRIFDIHFEIDPIPI